MWTGRQPPKEAMQAALRAELGVTADA
jgi:hypothetical protein